MLKEQIEGKNDSWAVRWYMSTFLNNMLTLYPGRSYVQNIGHDAQGTHCIVETDMFKVHVQQEFILDRINIEENIEAKRKIEQFFKDTKGGVLKRIKSRIARIFI